MEPAPARASPSGAARTLPLALLVLAAAAAVLFLPALRPPRVPPPDAPDAGPDGARPEAAPLPASAAPVESGSRGIRGRVLVPAGTVASRLLVRARAGDGTERVGEAEPDGLGGYRYELADLPPGRWTVAAKDPGGTGPEVPVTVAEGMAEADLSYRSPAEGECFLLYPLAPDGRPVPVAEIPRWAPRHPDIGYSSLDFEPRPDGSCLVGLPEADGPFPVPVSCVISPAFGQRKLRVPRTGGGEVRVCFEEPAFLAVTVVNLPPRLEEDGCALFHLSLPATEEGEAAGGDGCELTSPETRFGPLQPGHFELRVCSELTVDPGGHTLGAIARRPVLLASGENRVTVCLPDLFDVTVAMLAGIENPGSFATLTDASGTTWHGPGEAEDAVTFRHLPAGRYVFELASFEEWDGRMAVTVPAPRGGRLTLSHSSGVR